MDMDYEDDELMSGADVEEGDEKAGLEDDLSIYSSQIREEELDNDQIADWEEAFMMGWEDAL